MEPLRVAFLHPDLGIGGAERLVVDAAIGLQARGHNVVMYTSHHDSSHCFEETRNGTLDVRVYGDWLPRSIFGKGHMIFAILRGIVLALSLLALEPRNYDVIFADQLSIYNPIARFTGAKILFYCHFPDKLLTKRNSILKRLYRIPIDFIEEITTQMADHIVVNSKFTATVFQKAFWLVHRTPGVLYPGIHLQSYRKTAGLDDVGVRPLLTQRKTLLSINRFERKKNVELALHSFAHLQTLLPAEWQQLRIVIAGGYDKRVRENVEYLEELQSLAHSLGLATYTIWPGADPPPDGAQVLFLPSFNEFQRTFLLAHSACLLYTPSNEHFGIVPIEAMFAGLPVVAVNSGGPTETVVDGKTGYLRSPDAKEFAGAIGGLLRDEAKRLEMKQNGRGHVEANFGLAVFVDRLEALMRNMLATDSAVARMTFHAGLVGLVAIILPLAASVYWMKDILG